MAPINKFITQNDGSKLPIFGFGTWQSPGQEVQDAVRSAIEHGYRHIDTAYVYSNEKDIGVALRDVLARGVVKRKDLYIVTKLPGIGMHPETVRTFAEQSLKNLQLDYVDLYLIHTPVGLQFVDMDTLFPKDNDGQVRLDFTTDHIAIWKEMEKLVDDGLVKSIGVSNFNARQIERIVQNARIKPANIQIEMHAYLRQSALIECCRQHNISIVAFSPLGSPGLSGFELKLKGKSRQDTLPKLLDDPVVNAIAKTHNKTAAQVLLRHLLQQNISVIPKSTNPGRIAENFNVWDFELTNEEVEALDGLNRNLRYNYINIAAAVHLHPEYAFEAPPTD